MSMLEPDRGQIEQFVNTIFRYVANEGYIPLKAFYHDQRPYNTQSVRLNGATAFLVDCAVDWARRCANEPEPIVFCPPLAVFKSADSAKEADLIAGPALSVELDENAREGLAKLEAVIGPSTLAVKSGGQWIDPERGEVQDKMHAHWRLKEPSRGRDNLDKLKQARVLATRITDGDPTNNSIVHPIRWPGSWHRKAKPRLCEIETLNPDREIDLDEALEALTAAAPPPKAKANGHGHDSENWEPLITSILDGSALHPSTLPLSMKLQRAGMHDGAVVNLTRALMNQSKARTDRDAALRWQVRYNEIPGMVSSGREKIEAEKAGDEPIPLFPPLPPAEIYPVAGLGPRLSAAALAIGRKVQVPLAIAAQSVLAAAALVAQAHADVVLAIRADPAVVLVLQ